VGECYAARVLIAAERLLIKLRQPAARADELIALRRRLRDERAREVSPDERALAAEVLAHKLAAAAALRGVHACGTCAAGQPLPTGRHDGGACCSGTTEVLFDDHELAALAHAGTHASDLAPPARRDVPAGCAFRGAPGCSLAVAHRPARCVHYLCEGLRGELHRAGALDGVLATLGELDRAMAAYTAVHRARMDREVLAPLVAALEDLTARK
jgi:hypothetical protein